MGYLDAKLVFSASQALTAQGETKSTNSIKLDALQDFYGNSINQNLSGGNLWLVVEVGNTAFTLTSPSLDTIQVRLYTDASAAGTGTMVFEGPPIVVGAAKKTLLKVPLPSFDLSQYLQLTYNLSSPATGGLVNAYLVPGVQRNIANQ